MTDSMPIPDAVMITTDAIGTIPDKRTGKNGKATVGKRDVTSVIRAWAAKITASWCKTVADIIKTGDMLKAAKVKIGHGEWCLMFEAKLVPFNIRTAQRLMEIADTKWLRKTATWPFLPPYYRALHALIKWDDECLTVALDRGLIHAEMTRADAENLWTLPSKPEPSLSDQLSTTWPDGQTKFWELIENLPTVQKIVIFRRTGPSKRWQIWGVEIIECPDTRTLKIKLPDNHCIIQVPLKATAEWPPDEQRRCANCGRAIAADAKCDYCAQRVQRAAEAVRIIKDVVAFRKYRESDLIKNHAFVFSAEAARLVAPKECDGNARRNAVRLLKKAIKEIEAQGS